ncbi:MAG TPA: response regulator [Actinomycetota bacterium]|nr:response regulator [Actinomycetota bacterium]
MRVLIVDDDLESALLLETLLKLEGHQPITAHSVEEALQMWTVAQPDLVISDNRMPGQTGIELIRYLRTRETLPIVMLTSSLTPALATELAELGCVGLNKTEIDKLPDVLAELQLG